MIIAYTGIVTSAACLETGLRLTSSRMAMEARKVALAVSQTLQNMAFIMPVLWVGYHTWKWMLYPSDPTLIKLLALGTIASPVGMLSYGILGLGYNPIYALGAPRGPKDLTANFTPLICNAFRVLNIASIALLYTAGNVSLLSAALSISATLLPVVAEYYRNNDRSLSDC